MKLSYVCRLVDDVPAAVSFWRDVMKLPLTYSDETIGYASFDTGSTPLAIFGRTSFISMFSAEGKANSVIQTTDAYLTFRVDDVDAVYKDLLGRGGISLAPPQDRPEMFSRTAHLLDSAGMVLELHAPLQ